MSLPENAHADRSYTKEPNLYCRHKFPNDLFFTLPYSRDLVFKQGKGGQYVDDILSQKILDTR